MSKAPLTTHILDMEEGRPAEGIAVQLLDQASNVLATGKTDPDGRIAQWDNAFDLPEGQYQLVFELTEWFERQQRRSLYPSVQIDFLVNDQRHYHIPLLLSAHGYSTYRGS